MSSGGVDLVVGWLGVEVLPDGVVMYGRSHSYKHVPNSMSKWDNAVTFEEDYPQTVAGPADQQLTQPGLLRLRRGIKFIIFKPFNRVILNPIGAAENVSGLTIERMTRAGKTPITV